MTKLKPCPFCGAPARLKHYSEGWNVYCSRIPGCGVRVGWITNGPRAVEIWNRRVVDIPEELIDTEVEG